MQTESNSNCFQEESPQEVQKNLEPVITVEQYKELLALLQQSKTHTSSQVFNTNWYNPLTSGIVLHVKSNNDQWILDIGSADHMCCHIVAFSMIKFIEPISINMPNGSSVITSFSGPLHFSPSFFLNGVLYIPTFTFNLISITKLTHTLNCKLTFQYDKCLIQEENSLWRIWQAKAKNELY